MFEAIMPSKRKAQQSQQPVNSPPTVLEQSRAIRSEIAELEGAIALEGNEEQRLLAVAAEHDGQRTVADELDTRVVALYAERAAGGIVDEAVIVDAERQLRDAQEIAGRAARAGAGARQAAAQCAARAASLRQRLATLRAKYIPILHAELADLAAASRARFEAARVAAENAEIAFRGEEIALREACIALRLADVTAVPLVVHDGMHRQRVENAVLAHARLVAADIGKLTQ